MQIYDLLIEKGIEVNEEEALSLQARWDEIQQLKQDLEEAISNLADIALQNVSL